MILATTHILGCVSVPANTTPHTNYSHGRVLSSPKVIETRNKSTTARSESQFLMVFGGQSGVQGGASDLAICLVNTI